MLGRNPDDVELGEVVDINGGDEGANEPLLSQRKPNNNGSVVGQIETTPSMKAVLEIEESAVVHAALPQRMAQEVLYRMTAMSVVIAIRTQTDPVLTEPPTGLDLVNQAALISGAEDLARLLHIAVNNPRYFQTLFRHARRHGLGHNAKTFAKQAVSKAGSLFSVGYAYHKVQSTIDAAGETDTVLYAVSALLDSPFTMQMILAVVQFILEKVLATLLDLIIKTQSAGAYLDSQFQGVAAFFSRAGNMALAYMRDVATFEIVRLSFKMFESLVTDQMIERSSTFPAGIAPLMVVYSLWDHLAFKPHPIEKWTTTDEVVQSSLLEDEVEHVAPTACQRIGAFVRNNAASIVEEGVSVGIVFVFNSYALPKIAQDGDVENLTLEQRLGYMSALWGVKLFVNGVARIGGLAYNWASQWCGSRSRIIDADTLEEVSLPQLTRG